MGEPDPGLRRYPGSRRLLVHPDAGRSGRLVRSLTGASDWRRELADRAGAAALAVAGTAPLRSADRWTWPSCSVTDLITALQGELPGLRLLGAATPRQPGRRRLSLLGRSAGTLTVIKLGDGTHPTGTDESDGGGSLTTEASVLRMLEAHPLPGIATPVVFAAGILTCPTALTAEANPSTEQPTTEQIEFIATSTIAIGSQRAALDAPLRTFAADLTARLSDLPRPDGIEPDAVPIHGDLTPWNLRRTRRGLALFDWESAGWGSPSFDLDMYRQACDDVRPAFLRRSGRAER